MCVTSCIGSCAVASALATAIERLAPGPRLPRSGSPSLVVTSTRRVRDEADEIVPLEIQRAGVVGLELEPAAIETDDLTGDAVAVGERDDVGPPLRRRGRVHAARKGERQRSSRATPDLTCIRNPSGRQVLLRRLHGWASGLPPSWFEISVIARCARTLLPASSRGGDTTAIPNLPGETAMRPPPTPLFAGSPV